MVGLSLDRRYLAKVESPDVTKPVLYHAIILVLSFLRAPSQ